MRSNTVRKLVRAAALAAIASVLMFIEIPMAFLAPWLKLDVSAVPVLLGGFAMGPLWGMLIQLAKSLLHMTMTQTAGIGEIVDILVGIPLMLPAALIYRTSRTHPRALLGMGVGLLCMMTAAVLANFFFINFGIFNMGTAFESMSAYFTAAVIPFNLIKGIAVCAITFFLYRPLRRFLRDPA